MRYHALLLTLLVGTAQAEVPVVDLAQTAGGNPAVPSAQAQIQMPASGGVVSNTAAPQSNAPTQANVQMRLLNRINALDDRLRNLRGQLEIATHQISSLQKQQQLFYNDLDARLQQVAGKTNTSNTQSAHASEQGTSSQAATTASTSTSATSSAATSVDAQTASTTPANDPQEKATYQAAYERLEQRDYPGAAKALEAFLKSYPQGQHAANAFYWLGELSLQKGRFEQAKKDFNAVLEQFPQSHKVPDALLKLGYAYYNTGEWQQAKQALNRVRTDYPNTPAARLALARLEDIGKHGF